MEHRIEAQRNGVWEVLSRHATSKEAEVARRIYIATLTPSKRSTPCRIVEIETDGPITPPPFVTDDQIIDLADLYAGLMKEPGSQFYYAKDDETYQPILPRRVNLLVAAGRLYFDANGIVRAVQGS